MQYEITQCYLPPGRGDIIIIIMSLMCRQRWLIGIIFVTATAKHIVLIIYTQ